MFIAKGRERNTNAVFFLNTDDIATKLRVFRMAK